MSRIATHATKDKLRKLVEGLAAKCDASMPKAVTDALRSLLAAIGYDDQALIRSSVEAVTATLATAIDEAIEKRLGWPQTARSICRQVWDMMRESPVENLDDLGTEIETAFNNMLKILIDMRDGPVKALVEKGYELKNAAQLESDIRELQQLKKDVLGNWPWSNNDLPPVDTEMLKASMDAFAQGERGERIEDLITRLGGKPERESA
jgi:hypothetical protein